MSQTVSNPPQGALLTLSPQQFTDNNGSPLADGKVFTFVAGTTVLATTWQDPLLTIENTNPINLNSAGKAVIWGLGNFTLLVQDSAGNQISSEEVSGGLSSLTVALAGTTNTYTFTVPGLVTSGLTNPLGQLSGILLYLISNSTNTGAATVAFNGLAAIPVVFPNGGALVGGELPEGGMVPAIYNPVTNQLQLLATNSTTGSNLPGEIRAFAGPTAPMGWVLCFGQAVSRTTFPNTFAAIGVAWGPGNGTTTYNLPDLRGRALFGADAMGGTAANNITSASLGGTGVTATAFAVISTATGAVTQLGLENPGAGYTSVPNVTISGGGGSGATAIATILNGVVSGIQLTAGGSLFTTPPSVEIDPPSSSTTAVLAILGGSELTQNHTHTLTDPGHSHVETSVQSIRAAGTGNTWNALVDGTNAAGGGAGTNPGVPGTSGIEPSVTGITIAPFGGGNSQNLPPAAIINWIIALS